MTKPTDLDPPPRGSEGKGIPSAQNQDKFKQYPLFTICTLVTFGHLTAKGLTDAFGVERGGRCRHTGFPTENTRFMLDGGHTESPLRS